MTAIGDVLRAMEDPDQPVHDILGIAAKRLTSSPRDDSDPELRGAREEVLALLKRRGWRAGTGSAGSGALAEVLVALRRAGHGAFIDLLDDYAAAAEQVALTDLACVSREAAREDLVERVVVGTVLGEAMFGALRRLAQAEASARVYEDGGGAEPEGAGA